MYGIVKVQQIIITLKIICKRLGCVTIDHYPLRSKKSKNPEISRRLNVSKKLGMDGQCLNPDFLTFLLFLSFLLFPSPGEETKICGSYTPVQYEYYTQTIICPTEGTGFMISAYDKTGVKTILELYEIKVGVII